MNINELQEQIFREIKNKLPADASIADELAKLLDISSDSVYRRIRGEKTISFEELYKIATHYNVSLDLLMNIRTGGYLFQGEFLNPKSYRYDNYLTGILHNMAYINSFKQKEIYYLCKETPFFHYFNCRELAAFKYFFWMSTLVYFPEFRNRKVNFNDYPDELHELGKKSLGLYSQVNSFEVWTIESWNTTLHQVEYYIDNHLFNSELDAFKVYEAAEKVLDHLEEQAKRGYKFNIDDPEKKPLGKFNMYFNETVIQDNSIMAVLDMTKIAFVPHTAINYLTTRDVTYCENYYQYVQNMIKRSTLISEVSEKERARYFRRMRERIIKKKETLGA